MVEGPLVSLYLCFSFFFYSVNLFLIPHIAVLFINPDKKYKNRFCQKIAEFRKNDGKFNEFGLNFLLVLFVMVAFFSVFFAIPFLMLCLSEGLL